MKHISIVDDELTLRENLSFALKKEGYSVSTYSNGLSAWKAYKDEIPDLYVLDIIMPRMDGLELCKQIRDKNKKVPIIFLSSKDEELDKIIGLETGSDDYMSKPFSIRELIARIKVILRRVEDYTLNGETLNLSHLVLKPGQHTAQWKKNKIAFTPSEYQLLLTLANASGKILSRSELYRAIFPEDQFINERAMDSHIKRIRRKLLESGAPKTILESVYGLGYKLNLQ